MEFNITKKIGSYLYLDENNRKWTVPRGMFKKKVDYSRIYSYNDILSFELIENGNSISKGGVGRAIIGGVLFGGIGAIVGGSTGHKNKQTCTMLNIKITLKNINIPNEYITFIYGETKKDSSVYKGAFYTAQEILSTLQIICEETKTSQSIDYQTPLNTENENVEEIKKYKKLLDEGIITQNEFEEKKEELLWGEKIEVKNNEKKSKNEKKAKLLEKLAICLVYSF